MLVECFGWGFPVGLFSWSGVEGVGDCSEVIGTPPGEVHAFGEVMTTVILLRWLAKSRASVTSVFLGLAVERLRDRE